MNRILELAVAVWACVIASSSLAAGPFAYVVNSAQSVSNVKVIDTSLNNAIVATIPVDTSPNQIALSPDGTLALVATTNNLVSVIDTAVRAKVSSIGVGLNPRGVAISPDGKYAFVANSNSTASVIDMTRVVTSPATAVIRTLSTTDAWFFAVSPDSKTLYAGTSQGVTAYDLNKVVTGNASPVIATIPLPGFGIAKLAVTPNGGQLYATTRQNQSQILVVSTAQNQWNGAAVAIGGALDVAFSPDSSYAYVAYRGPDQVQVIDTRTLSVVSTVTGASGGNLAITPDGRFAYVTHGDGVNDLIYVVDTSLALTSPATAVVGQISEGGGPVPAGVAVSGKPTYTAFQNGSFENGTPPANRCNNALPVGSQAITGWTVIAGNIDWVDSCAWAASQGASSLDLVGSASIGGVQQTFATVPGQTYRILFDVAGNPNTSFTPLVKKLTATVNSNPRFYTFDATGKTSSNMGWTSQAFTFLATGPSSTVQFVSDMRATSSTFAGAALDNVQLVATNPNLILNGGFESPDRHQSDGPFCSGSPASNWFVYALTGLNGGNPCVSYNGRNSGTGTVLGWLPAEGNQSLSLTGSRIDQVTTVQAGATYDLTFRYAAHRCTSSSYPGNTSLTSSATIKLQPGQSTSSQVNLATPFFNQTVSVARDCTPSATLDWKTYTVAVQIPAGTTQVTLSFSANDSTTTTSGIALDDVSFVQEAPPATTTTVITSSDNPASIGLAVMLRAVVNGGGLNTPAGTVSFAEGSTPLPGCTALPLAPYTNPGQGFTDCSVSLPEGDHTITATYSGDASSAPSTGSIVQTFRSNTVVNGGFEFPNLQTSALSDPQVFGVGGYAGTYPGAGWNVIAGTIAVARNFWQADEGSQSVELNPTARSGYVGPGTITQSVAIDPRVTNTFRLQFRYAPRSCAQGAQFDGQNASMTVRVAVGTTPVLQDSIAATVPCVQSQTLNWTTYSRTFETNSNLVNVTLASGSTGLSSQAAMTIDNVQITPVLGPVPQAIDAPWLGTTLLATTSPQGPVSTGGDGTGASGAPTFFYSLGSPPFGNPPTYPNQIGSGSWKFVTTAATTRTIQVGYLYTGFHAFAGVTVRLDAVVNGSTVQTLVSAGPQSCTPATPGGPCPSPSGGFSYGGTYSFAVNAGDTYGFVMSGSNGDADGRLQGTLTVTGTNPTSVALTNTTASSTSPMTFTATVSGYNPIGTVTFADGATPISGCEAVPLAPTFTASCQTALTAGGHTITATYIGDRVNASAAYVQPMIIPGGATASTTTFTSSVNPSIAGAGLTLNATVSGNAPGGTLTFLDGSNPVSNCSNVTVLAGLATCSTSALTVGSHTLTAHYNGDGQNLPSTSAALVQEVAIAAIPTLFLSGQTDATGTAFRAFGNVPGVTTGSAGDVAAEYVTGNSCVNGVLSGGLQSHSATAYFATAGNGYFIADVTGTHDQYMAIRMHGSTPTVLSNCVPLLGDNDAWPRARELANTPGAIDADFIDQPGRARWFKFRIIPGQTVTVNIAGLPADYDLALFKDISAAYQAQITAPPATTQQVAKLSAEFAPSAFSPSAFSPSAFSPSAFSPSAFSPSAFSPSAFSPSAFSPSAFSPSAFSPSAFSPSAFSPSAFSPSAFSPSAFSPSAFSPSAFSPSAFSPSAFSPSAFSPSAFSPVAQAFAAAQTQTIVAVSATPGTSDESVLVNTWTNTGYFYVRVTGRGTASSASSPFQLTVKKDGNSCANVSALAPSTRGAIAGAITTLIVTDSSKLALDAPLTTGGTLRAKLSAFATANQAVVADVADDARVSTLRAQAEASTNKFCPYAMNLLAEEIKSVIDAYRAGNPSLKYIVLVGADDVIPFFRYPDETLLGKESGYVPPVTGASDASLRQDYVLTQDTYGAARRVSLRLSDFPVPGLAVGRLIKTPDEIAGMLDAYTQQSTVTPQTALVTGYDFLSDVATQVKTELSAGLNGGQIDSLISPATVAPLDTTHSFAQGGPWTASDLRTVLLGQMKHDMVFIAGHFSANSTLAADFSTSLLTTDLAAAGTDFTNSIVFSAGCHSGYDIVAGDAVQGVTLTLDWTEAFAQKRATLIAGTGYQYGDTDFIEYSERIYLNFAKALRTGSRVNVGDALVKAKIDYLAITPDIRGLHQKALLEATLYGLPMLGVTMQAPTSTGSSVQSANVAPTVVTATPGAALGLSTGILNLGQGGLPMVANDHQPQLDTIDSSGNKSTPVVAHWLGGPSDLVTANPYEPVLPLNAYDVSPPTASNLVLRGVGFREGDFTVDDVVPLTGAPATEIRGVHVPFASPFFYPMRLWTPNYWGLLTDANNGKTSLLVTPAQHQSDGAGQNTSTRRAYTRLKLQLYYSGVLPDAQLALSDAPTIVSVTSTPAVNDVLFTVKTVANPLVGVQQVWVTSLNGNTWSSIDLQQCTGSSLPAACGTTPDSTTWVGNLGRTAGSAGVPYIVQAVSGIGLVAMDDNRGAYYLATSAAPVATTLTVGTPTNAYTYGDTAPVTVSLSSTSAVDLSNKKVNVSIGGASASGKTGAGGTAIVNVPITALPGTYQISASFAGDASALASSASTRAGSFTVNKAPSALSAFTSSSFTTKLMARVGAADRPLLQEAVTFNFLDSSSRVITYVVANTDLNGVATLPQVDVPAGTYTVAADFGGDPTFSATSNLNLGSITVQAQSIDLALADGGNALPSSLPVNGTVSFSVTSTAAPVIVTLAPPSNGAAPACSLSNDGATYTLTGLAPGACMVTLSANATPQYAATSSSFGVAVQAVQAIQVATITTKTFGTDTSFTLSATGGASGNPVTFSALNPSVCTVTGNQVTILAAGTCPVEADQAGNNLYSAAPPVQIVVTINRASQTIIFGALADKNFGDADFNVSASTSSGLTVSFSPSGACTINGTSLHLTGAGSCTITANQAGDGNYTAAGSVQQAFNIGKASSNTLVTAAPAVYDGSPHGATATVTGFGGLSLAAPPSTAVTITYSTVGTTTCSSNNPAPVNAGTYYACATFAGDTNHGASSATTSFTIAKADQTITFSAPSKTFGDTDFNVSGTATSGLPVAFSAGGTCTINATLVHITSAGDCTITAKQPGNANYNAANDVAQTFNIALASSTTTLTVPTSVTFDGSAHAASATATGVGLNLTTPSSLITITYSTSGSATCSSNDPPVDAGTYLACASFAGDQNHTSSSASNEFTIAKAVVYVSGRVTVTPSIGSALRWTSSGSGSITFGDDLPPDAAAVTFDATITSGAAACMTPAPALGQPPVTVNPTPTTPLTAAQPYVATPSNITFANNLGKSCEAVLSPATLTVNKAQAIFALLPTYVTLTGTNTLTIIDELNRTEKPGVYPKIANGDLPTGAFNVTLSRNGVNSTTVMTTNPSDPEGLFTITDSATPGIFGAQLTYAGGTNFLAAKPASTANLRIEGFTALPNMTQARSDHTSTLLKDGRVLLTGGNDASGTPQASAEVYCPTDMPTPPAPLTVAQLCPAGLGQFSNVDKLHGKSAGHSATRLFNGQVLLIGGGNSSTDVFNPVTNQFAAGAGSGQRSYHTATLLPNGKVLLVGGVDAAGKTLQTTQIYDPSNGSFAAGPTLLAARERHTATLYTANGFTKVLIAGGRQKNGNSYVVLNSVEVYDVAANTVSPAPSMAAARFAHAAEVLDDGRVLVSGGSSDTAATPSTSLDSAELFKVAVNGAMSWTLVASPAMHDARRDFTLTKLVDGRILAIGGAKNTSRVATSEYFSPDAFTLGASMVSPPANPARSSHAATQLANGSVLVTGGVGNTGAALNSAQLYNGPSPP